MGDEIFKVVQFKSVLKQGSFQCEEANCLCDVNGSNLLLVGLNKNTRVYVYQYNN
jgi:hypothetical protein